MRLVLSSTILTVGDTVGDRRMFYFGLFGQVDSKLERGTPAAHSAWGVARTQIVSTDIHNSIIICGVSIHTRLDSISN